MNVVFIGGGNMADALIGGLLKSGLAAAQVRAVEVDGAARRRLSDKYRIECAADVRGTIRAGEVVVFAPNGDYYGAIRLPEGAGSQATNVAFHDGYLYITEAEGHTVWRVKTKIPGIALYGGQ